MEEKAIAFITRKDIHAGISNFIHNELKISREDVAEVMKKRVEEVIDSKIEDFLNSKYFQGLVERSIVSVIRQGVNDGFYGRDSFENFFTREISRCVHEMVSTKYKVKVEEK